MIGSEEVLKFKFIVKNLTERVGKILLHLDRVIVFNKVYRKIKGISFMLNESKNDINKAK